MSGQKRPSTGLRDCKIESSASGQYLTIFFVLLNSRVPRGRESVMVQQQPVVPQQRVQKQQHQEHQSLSMSRACKPTPLRVSRAEMMQEQKRHTHTLHALCMNPPLHACTYMHTPLHAHTHMHANLCAQMHTQTHMYVR